MWRHLNNLCSTIFHQQKINLQFFVAYSIKLLFISITTNLAWATTIFECLKFTKQIAFARFFHNSFFGWVIPELLRKQKLSKIYPIFCWRLNSKSFLYLAVRRLVSCSNFLITFLDVSLTNKFLEWLNKSLTHFRSHILVIP